MIETKHTAGPFRDLGDRIGGKEEDGAYDIVALTPAPKSPKGSARERQWQADKRLFLAAPDLLAALQALVQNPAFELGAPKIEGRAGKRRTAAEDAWNGFIADAHAAIALATTPPASTPSSPAAADDGAGR